MSNAAADFFPFPGGSTGCCRAVWSAGLAWALASTLGRQTFHGSFSRGPHALQPRAPQAAGGWSGSVQRTQRSFVSLVLCTLCVVRESLQHLNQEELRKGAGLCG